jgi:diguanylate cyclase (GGDEF)-like protein
MDLDPLDDDLFEDDDPPPARPPWRIAIIDDAEDVHAATEFALRGFLHLERPLEFLHAHSAAEGFELFRREPDIAVAFVDVVMESDNAGLQLVERIRTELGNRRTRLVLRTGQPGYAPETEVVRRYDINDYREKAELDYRRLLTTLIAALRAYEQIETLERHRDGLSVLIDGLGEMFGRRAIEQLAEGVLKQISALLKVPLEGVVCITGGSEAVVVAAAGALAPYRLRPLRDLPDQKIAGMVERCLEERRTLVEDGALTLHIQSEDMPSICVYVAANARDIDPTDQQLLTVFGHNVALAFENAKLVEHIRGLAYTDATTGLPTEIHYREVAQELLDRGERFAVMLVDILRFRVIADGLGPEAGDNVLRAFARLLRDTFPDALFIGRRNKDEFLLVTAGGAEAAEAAFHRLHAALLAPLGCVDIQPPLRVRAGVAVAPEHGATSADLLTRASVAMYEVKRDGGTWRSFRPQMLEDMVDRLRLTAALQNAAEENRLSLHFQPLVEARSLRLIGAEALLRVEMDGVLLPVQKVIEAAEHSGMIVELGIWVLRAALAWQAGMRAAGLPVPVSVNVSPTQLRYGEFRGVLARALEEFGTPPGDLTLEVTEGLFVDTGHEAIETFSWFRDIGGRIAIDDFGTGYSSFGYLHRLPIDIIKIDRSFVAPLDEAGRDLEKSRRIAESMVRVANTLNLKVTAEGVETEAQRQTLLELGVDTLQGYLLGRPVPASETASWRQNFKI